MKVTKLHIPRHLIAIAFREWLKAALRQMHLVQAVRSGGHFLIPGLVRWFVEISNSQTAGRHLLVDLVPGCKQWTCPICTDSAI